MNLRFLILFSACICILSAHAQTNKALADKLAAMVAEDQQARHLLDNVHNKVLRDSMWKIVKAIDKKHNPELKAIIKTLKRYPDYDIVGKDGAHNFWLLVQHQDKDIPFQKKILNMMSDEVYAGKAAGKDYAYLLDRVLLNTGSKQVYGTQLQLIDSNKGFEPRPLIMPEKVDERRNEMGIGPIAEYIDMVNKQYGYKKKQ